MRRERSVVIRFVRLVALVSCVFAVGMPALQIVRAGRHTLPRCRPEGYGLEQAAVPHLASRPQAIKLTLGWLTAKEHRSSCRLRTAIRLTIFGSSGVAARATWRVNSVQRPWSQIVHTWVWQNWCETSQGEATVESSDSGGKTASQRIASPPTCVSSDAPSTITDLGTGTKHATRPSDPIPPHILPKGAPPPLHYSEINPKNGWIVSDGYTLVAVYAGSPGGDPAIGRFAIIRQNALLGGQYAPNDTVDVGRVGPVKITRAPRGRSRETTAQYGRLAFVAADGTKGVLDLKGDRIRITRRP